MDRYYAIALYWLSRHDTPNIKTMEDYIRQFDEIVYQIKGVDENLKREKTINS